MPAVQMSFSLDAALKDKVDEIYSRIGLTVTDAIRMFLRQSVQVDGLPLSTRVGDLVNKEANVIHLTPAESERFWKILNETTEEQAQENVRRLLSRRRGIVVERGVSDL